MFRKQCKKSKNKNNTWKCHNSKIYIFGFSMWCWFRRFPLVPLDGGYYMYIREKCIWNSNMHAYRLTFLKKIRKNDRNSNKEKQYCLWVCFMRWIDIDGNFVQMEILNFKYAMFVLFGFPKKTNWFLIWY